MHDEDRRQEMQGNAEGLRLASRWRGNRATVDDRRSILVNSDTLISGAVFRNRWSRARNRAATKSVLAVSIERHVTWIILLLGIVRLRLSLHLAINILEEGNSLNQTAMMVSKDSLLEM
jgi:hypothetical protein